VKPYRTKRPWIFAFCLLSILFVCTRAFPLFHAQPWSYWEVFEAKKLSEYGFFERRGALLDTHYLTGVVPHPEKFNYINHPAPIHWVNMLIYQGFGDWGILFLNTSLGLLACLLTLATLRKVYPVDVAVFGAFLFTVAPSSIIFDVDPCVGPLASFLWPAGAYLLLADHLPLLRRTWLLGVLCLVAGQIDWLSWTILGSLTVATLGIGWNRRISIHPHWPLFQTLFLGGALTVLFFAAQIFAYIAEWNDLARYISKQGGNTLLFAALLKSVSLRIALSLSPALLLAGFFGFVLMLWRRTARPMEMSALIYLPIFFAALVVLQGFFLTEIWPYEYLIFPFLLASCYFLSSLPLLWRTRLAYPLLCVLALSGILYAQLQTTSPKLSTETSFLAELFSKESAPREVIATNMVDQLPPLPSWNVAGLYVARQKADRLLRTGIGAKAQLFDLLREFHTPSLDILFVSTPCQPIDPPLEQLLQSVRPQLFKLPPVGAEVPFSIHLRNLYWRFTGRHQAEQSSASTSDSRTILLYHFRLARSNDIDSTIQLVPLNLKP
jgi:hypothetical protein